MAGDATAKEIIENRIPTGNSHTVGGAADGRFGKEALDPGENHQAAVVDAKRMDAAEVRAAAQLVYLQLALGPPALRTRLEFDETVHHRMFRREILRRIKGAGQQKHRASGKHRMGLKFM